MNVNAENKRLMNSLHSGYVIRLAGLNALKFAVPAGIVAAILLLFSKFFVIPELYLYLSIGAVLLIFPLSGFIYRIFRPASTFATAITIDRAANTRETISTWLENAASECRDSSVFNGLLAERAFNCLDAINKNKAAIRVNYRACRLWLLSITLAMTVIYLLPQIAQISLANPGKPQIIAVTDPKLQAKIKEQELKMKKLAVFSKNEDKKDIAQEMNEMFNKLKKDGMEKQQFLAKFSEASDDIKKELEKAQKDADLANAGKELGKMKEKLDAINEAMKNAGEMTDKEKLAEELADLLSEMKGAVENAKSLKESQDSGNTADAEDGEWDGEEEIGELADELLECLGQGDPKECSGKLAKLLEKSKQIKKGDKNGAQEGEELADMEELLEAMDTLAECDGSEGSKAKIAALRRLLAAKSGNNFGGGDTTDEDAGRGPRNTVGDGHDEGGTVANTPEEYKALYAPKEIDGQFENSSVKGRLDTENSSPVLVRYFKGAPGQNKESRMPVQEVLPKYLEDAEKSLTEEEIPAEYKETIKKYFESLRR